jgi:hypothetical protein
MYEREDIGVQLIFTNVKIYLRIFDVYSGEKSGSTVG